MLKLLNKSVILTDSYLNVNYHTVQAKAKDVTKYLRETLKKSGINPNDFNQDVKKGLETPPIEIYEYQPFFLLHRTNGEYTLLDGFRRLLWYNSPDHTINIRVYEESDLTSQQIMMLMVYLNHFKFYGGNGYYYDRGFSLAMRVIFDLNIPKFYETFNSYLTLDETERNYSRERKDGDTKVTSVKTRLLNEMFVDDMKFIESLVDTGVMLNDIFGSLLFKIRTEYSTQKFDSKFFLDKVNDNKLILDLQKKYEQNGGGTSSEGLKTVNRLIPLYENIFIEMFGGEVEKKFAEILDETKKIAEKLRKDKSLTKLTGNQKCYLIERVLEKRFKTNTPTKFKCVVYPIETNSYSWDNNEKRPSLDPGLMDLDVTASYRERSLGGQELILKFKNKEGDVFTISHNYSNYGYGKKYTKVYSERSIPIVSYDVELFVDVTKEDVKVAEDKHFNR